MPFINPPFPDSDDMCQGLAASWMGFLSPPLSPAGLSLR